MNLHTFLPALFQCRDRSSSETSRGNHFVGLLGEFVMHSKCVSYFSANSPHITEALNCFRLRLGFDLFHNLIKMTVIRFCAEPRAKTKPDNFHLWTKVDEHIHRCSCDRKVEKYSICAILRRLRCHNSRGFQKKFHL